MSYDQITYMNQKDKCIVCGKKPVKRESHILVNGKPKMMVVPLQKHHVKYNPQIIAYVHDFCHVEINEGKHQYLVQYEEGEAREFYERKGN